MMFEVPKNPLIDLFERSIPYLVLFMLGFAGAWYIQGLRIVSAKQDLTAFKQAATKAKQDREDEYFRQSEEVSNAWAQNIDALRRRYAAGGVLPQTPGSGSGLSAPTTGTDAIATYGGSCARRVAEDSAETTLQLMMLQDWVERISKEK